MTVERAKALASCFRSDPAITWACPVWMQPEEVAGILENYARMMATALPDSVQHIERYRNSALGRLDSAKVVYEHCGTLLDAVRTLTAELAVERGYRQCMQAGSEEHQKERDAARAEVKRLQNELYAAGVMQAQTEKDHDAERQRADKMEAGLPTAGTDKKPRLPAMFLRFGKSDLLKALDLIGPAVNEEHFQARLSVATLIVREVISRHEGRPLRVDHLKCADTREIQADLDVSLAGTEFVAKVFQSASLLNRHNLVVDLNPKQFIFLGVDFAGGPDWTVLQGETYRHDCAACTPLGVYLDHTGLTFDLYYCAKSIPTVIARYGNKPQEYTSGLGAKVEPLIEAERRARERGLL